MPYIELAFVVVCVVAVLHATGRHVPVPMAALQIAAGAALSACAPLGDLREQSALLFVMLVPLTCESRPLCSMVCREPARFAPSRPAVSL